MEYASVPGIAIPVARIVYGTASLSGPLKTSGRLLDDIFTLGGNAFDTARVYGLGRSESALGRWMRSRGNRDRVVIISKGAHPHLLTFRSRFSPKAIRGDLHRSLRALQTDYIDLYLLHRDDTTRDVDAVVDTLIALQREGLIRSYGYSNWTPERIAAADGHARSAGGPAAAMSSPQFSLAAWTHPPLPGCVSLSGSGGRDARRWYSAQGMPVLAWSALAGGFFARTPEPRPEPLAGGRPARKPHRVYDDPENGGRLDRAQALGAEKGASVAQVALAYLLAQPFPVFPVVATRNPTRFEHDARACSLSLSAAETAWLEAGDGA